MQRIARFEKVSFEEFKKSVNEANFAFTDNISDEEIREYYDKIKLPRRATDGSGGYDFYSPFQIYLHDKMNLTIPTGIRCKMEPGWVLKIYPRSGLGFKYGVQLANTVGIIDQDYYFSDNEGHIKIKIVKRSLGDIGLLLTIKEKLKSLMNTLYIMPNKYEGEVCFIEEGKGFCQGVFQEFGITYDDQPVSVRNGGFGSTDNN